MVTSPSWQRNVSFDRLGAMENRVGDQLARDQGQDSYRTVERPLRDEPFDKATRKTRAPHIERQWEHGARHGGTLSLIGRHPDEPF
jgi:hypothetical protein